MKTELKGNTIREQVSEAYTRALHRSESGGGCCSGGTATARQKAIRTTRYGNELENAPDEAAQSSFGCGNPLAMAGIREGQTALDLGSGAGLDLILAARKVGESGRAIGVDMTTAMVEAARRNVEKAGLRNTEVRQGLIEDLPVESGSVDWVISNCVINLSPEKKKVFSEIHRVLRPGGRFSISDIVVEGLPSGLRRSTGVYCACVGGAVTEAEYLAGLDAAGLTEVRVEERQGYAPEQVREIIVSELGYDVPEDEIESLVRMARVESLRFTGRRPE